MDETEPIVEYEKVSSVEVIKTVTEPVEVVVNVNDLKRERERHSIQIARSQERIAEIDAELAELAKVGVTG